MRKFWLIARAEYERLVKRRAFLLATFGMPVFITGIMAMSILVSIGHGASTLPVGVVDQAGVLEPAVERSRYAGEGDVEIKVFSDETAAQAALRDRTVQAYYVLQPDYLQTGAVRLFYWDEPPGDDVRELFDRYLRVNLIVDRPQEVQQRVLNGVDFVLRSADGRRQARAEDFVNFILPFAVGMFFVFIVMGTAGYLLQAVTTEKENRMVEVMFTSVGAYKLIAGKAVGLMAVAFTQIGIWVIALAAGLVVASRYLEFLQTVHAPWGFLLLVLMFFIPTYALIAGIMITVGSMVTELQQAQQIAGMVNLLFVIPFFFTVFLFTDPDSPIMVALTLFPTTAFITVAMRWGVTALPLWQIGLSWLLLTGTALASIFIASRVFRVGMLRYGQAISLRGLLAILRSDRVMTRPAG